jgi:hypothetical protein
VIPLSSLTERATNLGPVETQLAAGVSRVRGFQAIGADDVRQALRQAKRRELNSCEGDLHCLAEVGKLVGATFVIAGESGVVADGQVVYLKAVDVRTEKETASTTALFRGKPNATTSDEARSAAIRLLAPLSYMGTLALKIDVPGAQVFVDGNAVGGSPIAPLQVSVGTHAVRITHPKFRDFVRFVAVTFDHTETVPVNLTAYPIVTDTMQETELRRPTPVPIGPVSPTPWYHKWWAVAGFGGVIAIATTVLVVSLHSSLDRDSDVTIQPP